MSGEARWIEDRIRVVMGHVRGAIADPALIGPAESALQDLRDELFSFGFAGKDAVYSSIEAAVAQFEANDAHAAVQHLSRALLTMTKFNA